MEVSVSGHLKELRSEKECIKKRGALMAKKIYQRLDQLKAAFTLEDVRNLPGHFHELKHDRKGQLAVDLIQPNRLIFIPTGNADDFFENGSLIWSRVKSVEIIEVTNYHD